MPASDKLALYRKKRSAAKTPEPFGEGAVDRPHFFVVQKHAARRLHYDFRLEFGGVLLSWAVPKGPSLDPKEKRLAVHVEDHPVDYGDFEGIIPKDNYGAGEVIVWDRGEWTAHEDPEEGMRKGKLLFSLRGHKLHGLFTLVRIHKSQKDWLLIKKPDGFASDKPFDETSVLSGRTVEDLRAGKSKAPPLEKKVAKLGAKQRRPTAADLVPMLATARDQAFSRAGWLFEIKYDGFRLMGMKDGDATQLRFRRGNDVTTLFPELTLGLSHLSCAQAVVDGEVVVLDDKGQPSFGRLQERAHLSRTSDIATAEIEHPAVWFVFDLLFLNGFDLRPLPLVERKALLRELLPQSGSLRYVDHVEKQGAEMYREAVALGLEGIVGKMGSSPYRKGRSTDWIKVRGEQTADVAIVGFTAPKGSRAGLGALHIAVFDAKKKQFQYAGKVGTGFSDKKLREIHEQLEPDRTKERPFVGTVPYGSTNFWVRPHYVAEVRFKNWTKDGQLRHPVFVRIRDDKSPEQCVREEAEDLPAEMAPEKNPLPERKKARTKSSPTPAGQIAEKATSFTNLDKIFWPEDGYTKGDLIEYYRAIGPWILPYLRDRPVVLTRFPDGIHGKSFFQKDAPAFAPSWIRTEAMWSEDSNREIHYFILNDLESLLYVANLGTIPLHVWSSRIDSLDAPDWCILDLDPKGASFEEVIEVTRAIHDLCDDIGLTNFIKTSGATGLHVLIPLGAAYTFEQCKLLASLLARMVVDRLPKIATVERSLRARKGRIYVDALQNGKGKLLAAPFCVRPRLNAPVSMPLDWREVKKGLHPEQFTIENAASRLAKKGDTLIDVLSEQVDLAAALAAIGQTKKH